MSTQSMTQAEIEKNDAKRERAHAKRFPSGCNTLVTGSTTSSWVTMCDSCKARVYRETQKESAEIREWHHLQSILRSLAWDIMESLPKTIEKFAADLADNPTRAFEWSREAFEAAARLEVSKTILRVINEHGLDTALRVAMDEALRGARWPSFSTSPTSNLVAIYKTAAWAAWAAKEQEYRTYLATEQGK